MTTGYKLWDQLETLKKDYNWVDLSREVSPETAHWSGFEAMKVKKLFDLDKDGFWVNEYTLVTQYGTHIDAPIHFVHDRKYLHEFGPVDMVLPLCVMDFSEEVKKNDDFVLMPEHIKEWEKVHGDIPAGSFVAFRSDWSKRPDDTLDNYDEQGNKHYPGWSVAALKYLSEERNVAAVGHEPSDTDPPIVSIKEGLIAETYILGQNKYQVELLINLDKLPPKGSLIFVTFPKIKDGTGFTARCFAIAPK